MKLITVGLILDVDDDAEAYDAMNDILRDRQRCFAPSSVLLDYGVISSPVAVRLSADEYQEGDAFIDERWQRWRA